MRIQGCSLDFTCLKCTPFWEIGMYVPPYMRITTLGVQLGLGLECDIYFD